MVWQSYDNQNIIILDEPMAEQLSLYLENKEAQLSEKIVDVILQLEGLPPLRETYDPSPLHLNEAVEDFSRKINRVHPNKPWAKEGWKFASRQINQALWSYAEVLGGCVTELFQQIDQMGFEQWNVDVIRAATSIKDELNHRMDDLIWAIRRLEQQLSLYRKQCEIREGKWGVLSKFSSLFSKLIDHTLEPTIRKYNKFLNFRYRKFIERYTGYLQLYEAGQQEISKFYHYPVLSSMDVSQQDKLKELFFLLTLWENNSRDRALQRTEPVRAIRSCVSLESATSMIRDYFFSIRDAIFDKSRLIKNQYRAMFFDQESKQPLVDNLACYRKELSSLKELIVNFKKFHRQTDPGNKSYIARLFVKSEKEPPKQFQELQVLINEIKNLDAIAAGFQSSLKQEGNQDLSPNLQNEVNKYLHEMGQPLASKDLMKRNAKTLMQTLQNLDEISSFDPKSVDFVCCTLCKAMCMDWKYHVLQNIPSFHKVYEIHQGISNISNDRAHLNRLHKFQRILNQLGLWIKNDETLKRAQDIDLDIHDIKAYLQDFLAYVQRLGPEEEAVDWDSERYERPLGKAAQALLQYLYLFGNFFSQLNPDNPEHRLMRKHLLFVDQYFEAIERKLQELSK